MKCPFCSHENTRVIDSRPAEDNNSIRRRRVCDECGKRFTTYEKIETIPLIIIKKDNNREAYDRAKIEAGVLRACHKRPVSAQQITTLVDEVENEIFNREEREIPSGTIGELVMNKLKDLDAVAYVRFASVYREFKDVNTFMDELKRNAGLQHTDAAAGEDSDRGRDRGRIPCSIFGTDKFRESRCGEGGSSGSGAEIQRTVRGHLHYVPQTGRFRLHWQGQRYPFPGCGEGNLRYA